MVSYGMMDDMPCFDDDAMSGWSGQPSLRPSADAMLEVVLAQCMAMSRSSSGRQRGTNDDTHT